MKLINERKELKNILSRLKKEYIDSGNKNPVIDNNLIQSEFMFYIVDRYLSMQKELLKVAKAALKNNE